MLFVYYVFKNDVNKQNYTTQCEDEMEGGLFGVCGRHTNVKERPSQFREAECLIAILCQGLFCLLFMGFWAWEGCFRATPSFPEIETSDLMIMRCG